MQRLLVEITVQLLQIIFPTTFSTKIMHPKNLNSPNMALKEYCPRETKIS